MRSKTRNPVENRRKRRITIHVPSVMDTDCHLVAHSLKLGKFENCTSLLVKPENWGDLRQIVQPVVDLVVKDFLGQHFVDDVCHRFDAIRYEHMNCRSPFISCVIRWGVKANSANVIKMLLAVGLDPDTPNTPELVRPSHLCVGFAREDFARLIFPCRPSMKAVNKTGLTPLSLASQGTEYFGLGDLAYPQRKILREKVKNYIEAGNFETRFPTLVELANEESWFAVKNLLRRQVVAESEFTEKLEGKTAAEWAAFLKEPGIAEEIRYYATAPSTRQDETAKEMTALVKKLRDTEDERSVLSSKVIKLEEKNEEFRTEMVAKNAKIEELSEAVSVLQTRLDEATVEVNSTGKRTPREGRKEEK